MSRRRALDGAQRQQLLRAVRRRRGLVQRSFWLQPSQVEQVKELEREALASIAGPEKRSK